MKFHSITFCALCLAALGGGLTACSSDDDPAVDNPQPDEEAGSADSPSASVVKYKTIRVEVGDYVSGESGTRSALALETNRLSFTWASNDKIGIFPKGTEDSQQHVFTVKSGASSSNAVFTGDGWGLQSDYQYIAYYPYTDDASLSGTTLSYKGQSQTGNQSTAALGDYDWMATSGTQVDDDALTFEFDHLNSVGMFELTVPVNQAYTQMTLRSNEKIFATRARLDLSSDSPTLSPDTEEMSYELSMDLSDVTPATNSVSLYQVTCFMMLPPADWTNYVVNVVLKGADGNVYQGTVASKNLQAGKAYRFSATVTNATSQATITAPSLNQTEI